VSQLGIQGRTSKPPAHACDIASLRIEIVPQERPKERKRANAPLAIKAGNLFAIDRDGQVSGRHRLQTIIRAENGQPNSAEASTPARPGLHPSSFIPHPSAFILPIFPYTGMRSAMQSGSSPSHLGFCAVESKMARVLNSSSSPFAAASLEVVVPPPV
jgi:hypothetical protein